MYAIIETGGKQFKVSEGDVINVEKLTADSNAYVFDKVLALVDGDNMSFGAPYLAGAKVESEILANGKAKKVIIYKYKSKKGFHKKKGHRQPYTQVKILKISK